MSAFDPKRTLSAPGVRVRCYLDPCDIPPESGLLPSHAERELLPIETIGESVGLSAAHCQQCSGKLLGRPIGYCRLEDDM